MAGFLALTALEGYLPTDPAGAPSPIWYPLGYTVKVLPSSALVLWVCRGIFRDLRPWPSPALLARWLWASGWRSSRSGSGSTAVIPS